MRIIKRREEMGEEAWKEYQRQRKADACKRYKKRNSEKVVKVRRNKKRKLIDYKGGMCELCGYNKDIPGAYHFHHKDPNQKEFGIATKNWGYERLKEEVDKCMLLCSNCHAEIHYNQNLDSKKLTVEVPVLSTLNKMESKKREFPTREKITHKCSCGSLVTSKDVDCVLCSRIKRRKTERPSKEQLEKLIWEKPTTKIAKDFEVSDKAIDKWCKSYGISKPPRGYWTKRQFEDKHKASCGTNSSENEII